MIADPPPATAASSPRKEVFSLTDRAYRHLRRETLSGRLEPGSEVSEADLAHRLSMSRQRQPRSVRGRQP